MTIIQDDGNTWIEVHNAVHSAVADNTTDVVVVTLDRPGDILAVMSSVGTGGMSVLDEGFILTVRNIDDSVIEVGDRVSTIESGFRHATGGAATLTQVITLIMRKSAT